MTTFLRLLADNDKASSLLATCAALRAGTTDARLFIAEPGSFRVVPGAPFAYWVRKAVLECFRTHHPLQWAGRIALGGLKTLSDIRFLRCWWEPFIPNSRWLPLAKGGKYSPFYLDLSLVVDWGSEGDDISWYGYQRRPREGFGAASRGLEAYRRPGLTWPRRTNGLSVRVLPAGCIFADKGPAAFVENDSTDELLALAAILNSRAFGLLVSLQLARAELAQSFEVGIVQRTPVPDLSAEQQDALAKLAHRAWALKRIPDTVDETSHAFLLPAALRGRLGVSDLTTIEPDVTLIQSKIDDIVFNLYGFAVEDREAIQGFNGGSATGGSATDETATDEPANDTAEDEDDTSPIDHAAALLSWAVGVAFGRFDWRLATGEREAPTDPEPFDPLPAKSPGMLPDGATPFHAHAGILVDDQGHPHDLVRLIEKVLTHIDVPVPHDVRRWLQRDFFSFHLHRYSKSRRKAPIYWPLATASGSYTLWVYYPTLTSQTLYTAIIDFIEPKLEDVTDKAAKLRTRSATPSREDAKALEALTDLEQELVELRNELNRIAPTYRPNHDDGVQITAAPLWPLFRLKPWQKLLKDTWDKLEKGDYDWSHLAMAYWPDRVRKKCETDKSLAIAHGLEDLYKPPADGRLGQAKRRPNTSKRKRKP